MTTSKTIVTSLLAALSTMLALPGVGAAGTLDDPPVVAQAVVRINLPHTIEEFIAGIGAQFPGTSDIESIPGTAIHLIGYSAAVDPDVFEFGLQNWVANGTLVWGELNWQGQAPEGKTDSLWVTQLDVGNVAYGDQYAWGLLGIGAAQQISTGAGVAIAVLDTGIDATHPMLASAVIPGANLIGGASTGDIGDGVNNDPDNDTLVDEMTGHGTFVAGLLHLVAPDSVLLPIVVLNSDGVGDNYTVARGVYLARDLGVDVINMSLGSTYHSMAVEEAVADAKFAGIFVSGSAGNNAVEDPREFPACDDGAWGVAATDENDIKAPFSNWENKLDFSAPGHSKTLSPGQYDPAKSIISTIPGGGYAIWRGTSFSSAWVSGAAALIRAQHPGWPGAGVGLAQISDAIAGTLVSTGVNIDDENPQYAGELGEARIDIGAAVKAGPTVSPIAGDLNGDGVVDGADIGALLAVWGTWNVPADFNFDGIVDGADLGVMLAAWGS